MSIAERYQGQAWGNHRSICRGRASKCRGGCRLMPRHRDKQISLTWRATVSATCLFKQDSSDTRLMARGQKVLVIPKSEFLQVLAYWRWSCVIAASCDCLYWFQSRSSLVLVPAVNRAHTVRAHTVLELAALAVPGERVPSTWTALCREAFASFNPVAGY